MYFCSFEAGDGKATYAMFDYNNPPNPQAPTWEHIGLRPLTTECIGQAQGYNIILKKGANYEQ